MKKKRLIIIVSIVLFYIILMIAMVPAEVHMGVSADGEPLYSISTLGDAFWYMLVTFTTVGYGDLTPVSPVGKVIGMIFMISSTGLLVLFINMIFSWMTGDLAPRFHIWKHRKDKWVILSSFNDEARCFMEDLISDGSNVFFICTGEKVLDNMSDTLDLSRIAFIKAPINSIIKKHIGDELCTVLLTDGDGHQNYETALHITTAANIRIICRTDETPDELDPHITLLDEGDFLARYYWQAYPVKESEKDILVIGGGSPVDRILERGLLINVFPEGRGLTYHIFGYHGDFCKDHHQIMASLESDRTEDAMIFHDDPWQEDTQLLAGASRIILCDEDMNRNLSVKNRIRKYFPTEGTIYVFYSGSEAADSVIVNRTKCVYNKDLMHSGIGNALAVNINELYRKKAGGDAPVWEKLSEFHRQANMAAADHLLTKVRLLMPEDDVRTLTKEICRKAYGIFETADPGLRDIYRKLEHDRWMRFYLMYNWRYDPVRNNGMRRHHLLVPFEELDEAERIKDDSAWQILNEDIF
ncbi:MAG: hypothetical protein K6F28_08730 [Lachnospiraceae bacterium]|nr:hypothetical protein [Lachnospiraceae bacterium]